MELAKALLAWYDSNKRELPWRRDKDPYKIWVSEIMLQQTRVEAVKPYFARWMERFPDIESLAAASEEDVIYHWQGLGYYSRARNLLAGAREVAEKYNAKVPDTRPEVERIKGIGEYTAGAITSIAYNKKETAVDGNVLRVFSRLLCIEGDIMKPAVKREITAAVETELPADRPGDFNQALMDLGSAVCIPKDPRCAQCPLITLCSAYQNGRQRELPVRSKAKAPVPVKLAAGIVCEADRYLLRKRPSKGTLAGMWEFPTVEMYDGQNSGDRLRDMFLEELGQLVLITDPLFQTTHTFSHRTWNITFYSCILAQSGGIPPESRAGWFAQDEWDKLSFAGPNRKAAEFLKEIGRGVLNTSSILFG